MQDQLSRIIPIICHNNNDTNNNQITVDVIVARIISASLLKLINVSSQELPDIFCKYQQQTKTMELEKQDLLQINRYMQFGHVNKPDNRFNDDFINYMTKKRKSSQLTKSFIKKNSSESIFILERSLSDSLITNLLDNASGMAKIIFYCNYSEINTSNEQDKILVPKATPMNIDELKKLVTSTIDNAIKQNEYISVDDYSRLYEFIINEMKYKTTSLGNFQDFLPINILYSLCHIFCNCNNISSLIYPEDMNIIKYFDNYSIISWYTKRIYRAYKKMIETNYKIKQFVLISTVKIDPLIHIINEYIGQSNDDYIKFNTIQKYINIFGNDTKDISVPNGFVESIDIPIFHFDKNMPFYVIFPYYYFWHRI